MTAKGRARSERRQIGHYLFILLKVLEEELPRVVPRPSELCEDLVPINQVKDILLAHRLDLLVKKEMGGEEKEEERREG